MLTRVRKWGNSLGLRIPKSFAEEARVEAGSAVDLSLERGRPVEAPSCQLDDLLSRVTKKNLHEEAATGYTVDREA